MRKITQNHFSEQIPAPKDQKVLSKEKELLLFLNPCKVSDPVPSAFTCYYHKQLCDQSRHPYFKGNEFKAQKENDLSKVTKLSCPAGLQAQVHPSPKPRSFYNLLWQSTHRPKFHVQDTCCVPSTALRPSGMLASDDPMGHPRQCSSPFIREGC